MLYDNEFSTSPDLARRWRLVFKRLMDDFESSRNLAEPLMESLLHTLEYLLLHGDEKDLDALEEWLEMRESAPAAYGSNSHQGNGLQCTRSSATSNWCHGLYPLRDPDLYGPDAGTPVVGTDRQPGG